jgi:hypothetical protein
MASRFTTNGLLRKFSAFLLRKAYYEMTDMSPAQYIRLLAEQGLQPSEIAAATGQKLAYVKRSLASRARVGRPGGAMSLESQIAHARQIAESAPTPETRSMAYSLLLELIAIGESKQAGG